jgi:hypothetical protein
VWLVPFCEVLDSTPPILPKVKVKLQTTWNLSHFVIISGEMIYFLAMMSEKMDETDCNAQRRETEREDVVLRSMERDRGDRYQK